MLFFLQDAEKETEVHAILGSKPDKADTQTLPFGRVPRWLPEAGGWLCLTLPPETTVHSRMSIPFSPPHSHSSLEQHPEKNPPRTPASRMGQHPSHISRPSPSWSSCHAKAQPLQSAAAPAETAKRQLMWVGWKGLETL